MVRLKSRILIGDFVFDFVNAVEISSSWDMFTDTAMIKLPKKLEFNGEPVAVGESALFKRGMPVEIWLGYDDELNLEFAGFVSDITPSTPMIIKCEDLMWQLKQKTITKSYKETTLEDLLTDVLSGTGIDFVAVDTNLGAFRISKASIVEVFEELKTTYGLVTWSRDGVIYCGLAYQADLQNLIKYDLNYNVAKSDSLIYKQAEDIKIKVQAVSLNKDNTKTEINFGDDDGEQKTFTFYDVPESDLKATAERELDKLKFDGYRGDMTAFGVPFARHQDAAQITDPKNEERSGTYLIKQTDTSFGVSGFRRKITLDRKI